VASEPFADWIFSPMPVIIVIAVSGVVALAIGARLVRDVAHMAIEKATPEGVPAVVVALSSLLRPLRMFLPWSSREERSGNPEINDISLTTASRWESLNK